MLQQCILLGLLAYLSWKDIREKELPLFIITAAGGAALAAYIIGRPFLAGEFFGGMAVGIFLLVCSLVSRGAIGLGDAYLFFVTGMLIGMKDNIVLFLYALVFLVDAALLFLIIKHCGRRYQMPFVPFVLAADIVMLLRQV